MVLPEQWEGAAASDGLIGRPDTMRACVSLFCFRGDWPQLRRCFFNHLLCASAKASTAATDASWLLHPCGACACYRIVNCVSGVGSASVKYMTFSISGYLRTKYRF